MKTMSQETYFVGLELMEGRIVSSAILEDRERYPFGEHAFNVFFEHFVSESFVFHRDFGCIFIYDAKENGPRHSYAAGWIFVESVDEFNSYLSRNREYPKHIGEIMFEYGGPIEKPRITVKKP